MSDSQIWTVRGRFNAVVRAPLIEATGQLQSVTGRSYKYEVNFESSAEKFRESESAVLDWVKDYLDDRILLKKGDKNLAYLAESERVSLDLRYPRTYSFSENATVNIVCDEMANGLETVLAQFNSDLLSVRLDDGRHVHTVNRPMKVNLNDVGAKKR